MATKTKLIVGKGTLKIQTESEHSMTEENYYGEVEDLFFGDNRPDIDEIKYITDPREQKELDTLEKEVAEIFTPKKTQKKETSNKRQAQKRKSKFDTFIYGDTQYIKVKNLFIRVFPDDFCILNLMVSHKLDVFTIATEVTL